jgi:hypothetical protein
MCNGEESTLKNGMVRASVENQMPLFSYITLPNSRRKFIVSHIYETYILFGAIQSLRITFYLAWTIFPQPTIWIFEAEALRMGTNIGSEERILITGWFVCVPL